MFLDPGISFLRELCRTADECELSAKSGREGWNSYFARGKYRGTSGALSTSGEKIQHPGIQSQPIIKTSWTSPIGSIARNNNESLDSYPGLDLSGRRVPKWNTKRGRTRRRVRPCARRTLKRVEEREDLIFLGCSKRPVVIGDARGFTTMTHNCFLARE